MPADPGKPSDKHKQGDSPAGVFDVTSFRMKFMENLLFSTTPDTLFFDQD